MFKPEPVGWWCEWEGECFSERCGKGPNHVHCTPVYTRTQVRKGFKELAEEIEVWARSALKKSNKNELDLSAINAKLGIAFAVKETRRRMEEW